MMEWDDRPEPPEPPLVVRLRDAARRMAGTEQAGLMEEAAEDLQRMHERIDDDEAKLVIKLIRRIDALEAALEPFAERALGLADLDAQAWVGGVSVVRWRQAARVLAEGEEGQHGSE